jgi:hypothetical protein
MNVHSHTSEGLLGHTLASEIQMPIYTCLIAGGDMAAARPQDIVGRLSR